MGLIWVNKLRFNADRTEVLLVWKIQIMGYHPALHGVTFPLKKQVCNLGVLLDAQLLLPFQVVVVVRAALFLKQEPKQASRTLHCSYGLFPSSTQKNFISNPLKDGCSCEGDSKFLPNPILQYSEEKQSIKTLDVLRSFCILSFIGKGL